MSRLIDPAEIASSTRPTAIIRLSSHWTTLSEGNTSRQKVISLVWAKFVKPVLLLKLYFSRSQSFALKIDLCVGVIDRALYSLSFALRRSER